MKFLKWFVLIVVGIFVIAETYIVLSGNTFLNTLLPYTIFKGCLNPGIDELTWFKTNEVATDKPQPWPLSTQYNKGVINDSAIALMEGFETVSFLVIKEDSLLFEKNWEGYNENSYINSFSMAKSITSMLIGCALKDGLIISVDEPVSNYVDEFKNGELQKITIKHLLTMSSGLGFKEDYSSMFSWPAEAYYGADVNKLTLTQAIPKQAPGVTWFYKGGDTQILGMILKKVTGKSVAIYASQKLWKPIGAEQPAYWSLDENGMEKVSCCWYTNARDYAKLAKLMMNFGYNNGVQIIDSSYVQQAITPANLVDENGKQYNQYGYQWWLMKHKGQDIFYARGIRGQYIFAIPSLKTIVVRLGNKRAKKQGDELPSDIYVYLDAALNL